MQMLIRRWSDLLGCWMLFNCIFYHPYQYQPKEQADENWLVDFGSLKIIQLSIKLEIIHMSLHNRQSSKDEQSEQTTSQLQMPPPIADINNPTPKQSQNNPSILPNLASESTHFRHIDTSEEDYNQFMNLPDKTNLKALIASNKHPSNSSQKKIVLRKRISTEPNFENFPAGIIKKPPFLPALRLSNNPKPLKTKIESISKLKDLYEKKIKLQRRLKVISKQLLHLKVSLSIEENNPKNPEAPTQVEHDKQSARLNSRYQSKSYSNSRNRGYNLQKRLLGLKTRNDHSPESMQSIEKNRAVISFIQKMHAESVQRDLERIKRNKKYLEHELNHVCMDCSKSKCQMQAYSGILSNSHVA